MFYCLHGFLQRTEERAEVAQDRERKDRAGQLNQSTMPPEKTHTEAHAFSRQTTVCTLPLLFGTGCAIGTQSCFQQLLWNHAGHSSLLSAPLHTLAMLLFTVHRAATPAPPQVALSPWIRSNKASHSTA